jgi:Ni,Fe-hydrogenase maturation factor
MAEDKSTAVLLAWGNAARGDDAAGLKVLEAILQSSCDYTFQLRGIELMQLNPENAYDLQGAEVVVFMDAHSSIDQGVTFQSIHPTFSINKKPSERSGSSFRA